MDKLEDPIFEQNKYLLDMTDMDGDRLTVASPWHSEHKLMMRIENDDSINGIIIDLPIALALIGILLPMIHSARFHEELKEYLEPDTEA
jgi:hypothetical protein